MVQAMQNYARMLYNAAQAFVSHCEPGFNGCVVNLTIWFCESGVNSDMHIEADSVVLILTIYRHEIHCSTCVYRVVLL